MCSAMEIIKHSTKKLGCLPILNSCLPSLSHFYHSSTITKSLFSSSLSILFSNSPSTASSLFFSKPLHSFNFCDGRHNGFPIPILNLYLFNSRISGFFRSYSNGLSSVEGSRVKAVPNGTWKIIDIVRRNEDDLESKLESMNVKLSVVSVTKVFRLLNCERVSAFRFFNWIRCWQPDLGLNSDISSLVIDNCGRLDDYDTMRRCLNDFKEKNVCLTKTAFGFLPVMITNEVLMKKSTQSIVDMLCEVGGSCYATGVNSLIEMFCTLGSFVMAKFVIKKTGRRMHYYNFLIKEMCKRFDFEGAKYVLNEMREEGCDPNAQTYNYLIGSLLKKGEFADGYKVFDEMLEKDCPPDPLTFEIFMHNCCRCGKFNIAFQFFDDMVARGIEPRISTHAAFIKGFFKLQRYEEAYKYVVDSGDKYKCSSNDNYSLLAALHLKRGKLDVAQTILSEMIKKDLRPNFSVYVRVLKQLKKSGREKIAMHLEEQFLWLKIKS